MEESKTAHGKDGHGTLLGKLRAEQAYARLNPNAKKEAQKKPGDVYRDQPFDSSYQSMLFGGAGTLEKPAWSDSTKGRLAIRMFSRGILGAAMFTIGGRIARTQMMNYDPVTFTWETAKTKPLQGLAKGFDIVFGKPIAAIASAMVDTKGLTAEEIKLAKANAEWDAVNFRTTSYYHSKAGLLDHKARPMNGRSLGSEIVNVSFDFAMMSVGDGMGRNLVQMVDPHIRKTWMVNDKGEKSKEGEKAHFSPTKFAQSLGVSAWRIFSKNAGEDWAVALPYVYQMRFQRKMFAKALREDTNEMKLALDHQWNGAAYKVSPQGKIVGDYQLPGAMDLHTRFVGYNFYTLMYREAYDTIGHKLKEWKQNGYGLHLDAPKDLNPLHAMSTAGRYVAKSFIKANLYMNPAVIPFWLMRAPQTKWRGALINTESEKGVNAIASTVPFEQRLQNALGYNPHLTADEMQAAMIIEKEGHNPIFNYGAAKSRVMPGSRNNYINPITGALPDAEHNSHIMYFGDRAVSNPLYGMRGPNDPKLYMNYERSLSTSFSKAINPFGQFSHWAGGKVAKLADKLPECGLKDYISTREEYLIGGVGEKTSSAARETFARNMVDASLAYTPYFFAKSEFGLRVDDTPPDGSRGKMDNAIYKFIDNVCAVNPRKISSSIKDIWDLSVHRDRTLVMREGTANQPESLPIAMAAEVPATTVNAPTAVIHPLTAQHATKMTEPDNLIHEHEKKWAESVAGKNLAAQFQPTNPQTRH